MALRVAIRGLESEITQTVVWYRSNSCVILLELECGTAGARVWCRVSLRSYTRETAMLH